MYKSLNDIFNIYKLSDNILEEYVEKDNDFNGLVLLSNYLIKDEKFNPEEAITIARKLNKVKFSAWLQDPREELFSKKDYLSKFYKIIEENEGRAVSHIDLYYNNKRMYQVKADHKEASGFSLIGEIADVLDCGELYKDFKEKTNQNKIIETLYFIKYFFISIFKDRLRKYKWKNKNKIDKTREFKINYFKLSIEETKKLRKNARSEKVNFIVYIIKKINDILKEELLSENSDVEWLMPINKKPLNLINKEYSISYNDYSFLPLQIKKNSSFKDIKKEISLSKKSYKWIRLHAELVLFSIMSNIIDVYKLLKRKQKTGFASFSYFGVSNTPFTNNDYFVGNSSASSIYPVTISCGVLNQELILAMDIHETIFEDEKQIERILKRVKDEILS